MTSFVNSSPVTPEFLELFAKGELAFDCTTVELTQLRDDSPKRYTGRGLLLLRNGEFQFRFYADSSADESRAWLDEHRKMLNWTPGEEIPQEEYFALRAVDLSGYEWTCAKTQVKAHGSQNGLVLTGRLFDSLVHTAANDSSESALRLYFFASLRLPLNVYATTRTEVAGKLVTSAVEPVQARFNSGGIEFHVQARAQQAFVLMRLTSSQPLSAEVETRVEEALRFVTMRPVRWCISEKFTSGARVVRLNPVREKSSISFLQEPLDPRPDFADDYWRLFSAYFEHVSQHDRPDEYHPITTQIFHLAEGESQQLDLVGLALSVAVEGVLKCAYPQVGAPSQAFLLALEQMQTDLKKLQCSEPSLFVRADGALSAMKSLRPGDQLKELVKLGVITKKQHRTWTKLRNAMAHAQVKLDPEAANKLWAECLTVYTLLLRLILHTIGYRGHYCEYASTGWPILPFSVPPTSAISPSAAAGAGRL